jgi:hypothetical protein
MKQFGFPQIHRGGDGGGGGGGGESGMDAFGMAMGPTDIALDTIDVVGGLGGPGGHGEPNDGFSSEYGVDSFSGPGSLGLTSDNFSDPGGIGAHNFTGGFGYGLDGVPAPTSNFADRGAPVWGLRSNPQPSFVGPNVDIVNWNDFNAIDAQAPGSVANNFAVRGDSFADRFGGQQAPAPGWASPFSDPSRGLPQQLFDDRFAGLPGKGLSPWAPGPSIGQIAVTPSQANPGGYSQATPGQSTPTEAFGLPAATHPGWSSTELDWNAIAGSGIDSMISDRAGTISPETLAIQQSQYIPQWAEAYGPTPGYWHNNRGAIDPAMLEIEAAQNRPQYIQAYGPTPGYWADERGAISDQDPEVLAMIARGLGPRG